MTIQKFKTFEEAERALWNFKPDEKYYKQVREFYKLFAKLNKFSYPHGVFKFKTFEEAEEHKMKAIIDSAKKMKHLKDLECI
jgi:cyclopropane fatty-acyl-phospholipid synthase-like methyltransferase